VFGRLKELWNAPRENERLKEELAKAKDRIASQRLRIKRLEEGGKAPPSIKPESIIWIFGGARTGSTWLARMMGELEGHFLWNEPLVGALFGDFYYGRASRRIGRRGKHHILGDGYRESWLNSIRAFVLREATGRFPEAVSPGSYLVIKEPNGSFGAPLLMEALPESRMILLIRDPRDVVASGMDSNREGGWHYARKKPKIAVEEDPDGFVRDKAEHFALKIEKTRQAYEAHRGLKTLVKYEELRADALGTMRRIYSELGMPADEADLVGAVNKYAWENIPEEEKGEGKIRRKATPGGWREDLTPEQARIVEEATRPLIEEFYP
jgi:hypothetical protein